MAAIDPNATQPVSPDQAAAAATGARRTRTATPRAEPIPLTPVAPPPAAGQPSMSPEDLARVLAGLGYGNPDAPQTVAHADDEGDLIQLVDTGVIRLPITGPEGTRVWRLRPPLFGEHKKVRGALADALGDIDQAKIALAKASVENNAAKASAATMDQPERSIELARIRKAQRDAEELADAEVERVLRPWWQLVFELLEKDGPHHIPAEFGVWMTDHGLAADVVNHWRSSPRVPGR